MRLAHSLLSTTKEVPSDAQLISHQLMLRSGMIRKLSSGLYTWLPLGLRVLNKVAAIVREEMDSIGAQEVLMPAIQPAELWQETGRWAEFGPLMLCMKDRHGRDFCFGPTHEEVITDLMRRELRSYKQLPQTFYQVQTKFRDELRPRFGVMRAREFLMKDAYSFHATAESLETTYQDMHGAYSKIFTRLGLSFRVVLADSGAIGGDRSQEFHVLADSGEDVLAYSSEGDYAANVERATALLPNTARPEPTQSLSKIATPGIKTVEDQAVFMKLETKQILKTLIVKGEGDIPAVALLIRGDHTLNALKAEKLPEVASPMTLIEETALRALTACGPGFVGPCGLNIPLIADHSVLQMADFSCGANEEDQHFQGINWERDCPAPRAEDLRDVQEGDLSPDGNGTLSLCRGIEVGHIFQLGSKYAEAMEATVLDETGRGIPMQMGCYGIGVSRIVAAAIEQSHDDEGIVWNDTLAPYQVAIIVLNPKKSPEALAAASRLYEELKETSISVLLDDRDERPGVKFKDMALIGIPHRLVIGDRGLASQTVEYKHRATGKEEALPFDGVIDFLKQTIA